ncbi:hypothetical protein D3C75_1129920 [compost metagenome]
MRSHGLLDGFRRGISADTSDYVLKPNLSKDGRHESLIKLVKPHLDLKNECLSFYQEWIETDEDLGPWVISRDPNNFEEMLKLLDDHEMGVGLPEGWVSYSTFWLVDDREG